MNNSYVLNLKRKNKIIMAASFKSMETAEKYKKELRDIIDSYTICIAAFDLVKGLSDENFKIVEMNPYSYITCAYGALLYTKFNKVIQTHTIDLILDLSLEWLHDNDKTDKLQILVDEIPNFSEKSTITVNIEPVLQKESEDKPQSALILDAQAQAILSTISNVIKNNKARVFNIRNIPHIENESEFEDIILFDDYYVYIRPCALFHLYDKYHLGRDEIALCGKNSTKAKRLSKILKDNECVYQDTSIENYTKRNWHLYGVKGINEQHVFLPIYRYALDYKLIHSECSEEGVIARPVGGYYIDLIS